MAGLYLIVGECDGRRLDAVSTALRHSNESEQRFTGELSYVWSTFDNPAQFGPAHDPRSGVHVVIAGRTAWSTKDWQRAEHLPFEGGLASRLILQRYLEAGATAVAPYNGAASVVVWDPRDRRTHLWTDQFGYHPAFLYQRSTERPDVITNFPDAIRSDPELDATLDDVSLVEFLRAWRATPPNTYYKYLKYAGAAMHLSWSLEQEALRRREYWQPFQGDFYRTCSEAAEDLSEALKAAVGERTAAANRVTLFVSGGSDSRVMLFGADDPNKITGINLFETSPTHESQIAKALCERAGAKYVGIARDNDYYPRMIEENVRWSGGMWCCEDSHYLGVKDAVDSTHPDLVMTACTTDWVFKGYGLEKTYQRLFGKCLPLRRLLPDRVDGFLPNYPLEAPPRYASAVTERMAHWFSDCPVSLERDRDYLLVEDRRIRPACYTVSVSGQIMYRTYPYDTFLADSRVAECYSKTPAKMKVNGDLWGQAAALVCRSAGDIVDANNGWRLGTSATNKLIAFGIGWIQRRTRKPKPNQPGNEPPSDHPGCSASWPDYGWYVANSPTVKAIWEGASQSDREHIAELWGEDPWELALQQWRSRASDFFRIMTLLQFLKSARPASQNAY